jgi:hypothetical protein
MPRAKPKPTPEPDRYMLSVSEGQLRVLIDALDTFARLGMGQLRTVAQSMLDMRLAQLRDAGRDVEADRTADRVDRTLLSNLAGAITEHIFGNDCGLSISSASHDAKVAYEMEKVFQKAIAARNNHASISVWHDGPLSFSGTPFAKAWVDGVDPPVTAPDTPRSPQAPKAVRPGPPGGTTRSAPPPSPGGTKGRRSRAKTAPSR